MSSPLASDSPTPHPDEASTAETGHRWEHLRQWVQLYARYIRISQVALDAGMSVEMAQALLLREKGKTRIPRTTQRLAALLGVFTRPPFNYASPVTGEK